MPGLVLGLLLWSLPHMFKRLAPNARAKLGEPGKGLVSLCLVLGIVCMTLGYKSWASPQLWYPAPWLTGVNNLLVLVAVYLFACSGMKTLVARRWRHPQLTAVILWAVAHLLVNGDLASVVLFGGLLLWALAEIALIEAGGPREAVPPPAGPRKEMMALLGAVVVYGLIGLVHGWVGPWPFGG